LNRAISVSAPTEFTTPTGVAFHRGRQHETDRCHRQPCADAVMLWEDGICATSKAIVDDQMVTATDTPEGKAYDRNMAAAPSDLTGRSALRPCNRGTAYA
jgi:hypothetical protein